MQVSKSLNDSFVRRACNTHSLCHTLSTMSHSGMQTLCWWEPLYQKSRDMFPSSWQCQTKACVQPTQCVRLAGFQKNSCVCAPVRVQRGLCARVIMRMYGPCQLPVPTSTYPTRLQCTTCATSAKPNSYFALYSPTASGPHQHTVALQLLEKPEARLPQYTFLTAHSRALGITLEHLSHLVFIYFPVHLKLHYLL